MKHMPAPQSSGSVPLNQPVVYYAWAANGDLLYIGVASDLASRISGHWRGRSPWIHSAERVTWEAYASRAEAERVESWQISTLCPRHNLRDNERRIAAGRLGLDFLPGQAAWERLGSFVRNSRGRLPQHRLARQLGISRHEVQALERGALADCTAQLLASVETALGWQPGSAARVLGEDDPVPMTAQQLQERAAAAMSRLSPADRL